MTHTTGNDPNLLYTDPGLLNDPDQAVNPTEIMSFLSLDEEASPEDVRLRWLHIAVAGLSGVVGYEVATPETQRQIDALKEVSRDSLTDAHIPGITDLTHPDEVDDQWDVFTDILLEEPIKDILKGDPRVAEMNKFVSVLWGMAEKESLRAKHMAETRGEEVQSGGLAVREERDPSATAIANLINELAAAVTVAEGADREDGRSDIEVAIAVQTMIAKQLSGLHAVYNLHRTPGA